MSPYDELVERINSCLSEPSDKKDRRYDPLFTGFHDLDLTEVNAWTYWQGMGVRHPKILLVGQDWGSLEETEHYSKAIRDMIENPLDSDEVQYFKYCDSYNKDVKIYDTDVNLAELFKVLGYQDIVHKRYQELFFTNLIPGERKGSKSTGGFKAAWVTDNVKRDFRDLVNILQPQFVICLGQSIFIQVSAIFGHKNVIGNSSFRAYLDSDPSPIIISNQGHTFCIFGVTHPGFYGTYNRNGRRHLTKDEVLKKQIHDWENIKRNIDSSLKGTTYQIGIDK